MTPHQPAFEPGQQATTTAGDTGPRHTTTPAPARPPGRRAVPRAAPQAVRQPAVHPARPDLPVVLLRHLRRRPRRPAGNRAYPPRSSPEPPTPPPGKEAARYPRRHHRRARRRQAPARPDQPRRARPTRDGDRIRVAYIADLAACWTIIGALRIPALSCRDRLLQRARATRHPDDPPPQLDPDLAGAFRLYNGDGPSTRPAAPPPQPATSPTPNGNATCYPASRHEHRTPPEDARGPHVRGRPPRLLEGPGSARRRRKLRLSPPGNPPQIRTRNTSTPGSALPAVPGRSRAASRQGRPLERRHPNEPAFPRRIHKIHVLHISDGISLRPLSVALVATV